MRCENCPFKTKAISGKGPVDSPFVIVGESPGSRELAVGKPFVGPSGQMLNSILKRCGFDSLGIEPYVINALNCYPANKDLERLEAGCRACESRVRREIAAHPRKVILTLGAAAAWSVTGDYSIRILASRGEIRKSNLASEGVVLAVHPAYVLRNGSALSVWQKDLNQAVKLLKGQSPDVWREPTWNVVERPSEYNELVDSYIDGPKKLVTGDVETDGLHWFDNRMLCLGITRGDGSHVDVIPEDMLYNMPATTKRLVEAESIIWNWHNGLFDIKWFMKLGMQARVDEDTILLSYALNENRGYHDLDQVAQHWIKAPRHKHMLDAYLPSKKTSYRVIPANVLYKYNAIDLSKTHAVWSHIREAVRKDPHLERLYNEILIPAVSFIAAMQLYGVELDVDKVKENELHHDKELEELRAQINVYAQKHLGHDINVNSPIQLKTLLYGKMGFGRLSDSTDEKTLINIQRIHDHPVIDLLLKHREVVKRRGTYVTNLLDRRDTKLKTKIKIIPGHLKADGRIHADYGLYKTSTGRLAGSDPNMLNQPRGPLIRSQYKAKEGHIFVEVDLNQAELRSLALMSGDPVLVELYTKNEESIHDITTAAFFASKKEMKADEAILKRCAHQLQYFGELTADAVYKEAKMRGKAVNFGIVYGREAFSLGKEFNIPTEEAQRWIEKWFETYSGAHRFIEWCRAAPMERRTLVTMYGRKKRFGVVTNENLRNMQNEAANFPHQSTASDIMLETAINVWRPLRQRWGAFIWNELYDAIYYELPINEHNIRESVEYVQSTITELPRRRGLTRVPFLGDAKIGFDWGHMTDYDPKKPIKEQLEGGMLERFENAFA